MKTLDMHYTKNHVLFSFAIIALTLCIAVHAFASEIVEVDLPELQGLYSYGEIDLQSSTFVMDRCPIEIYDVKIRIVGYVNVGEYDCNLPGDPPGTEPYVIEFVAMIEDTVSGDPWYADDITPFVSGDFSLTIPFVEIYGYSVTWDFLKSGYGTVDLIGIPNGLVGLCYPIIYPDALVTEAVLVVEADFPISTQNSTWGSIKALYR